MFVKTGNNLIGNDQLIMERWKEYFYETLNIKNGVEIREEVIYQGPEEQIEPITKDEVWEVIRTLKNSKSPGEENISAEIIKYDNKKLWEVIHALSRSNIGVIKNARELANCNYMTHA